jgi:hypothetical protein
MINYCILLVTYNYSSKLVWKWLHVPKTTPSQSQSWQWGGMCGCKPKQNESTLSVIACWLCQGMPKTILPKYIHFTIQSTQVSYRYHPSIRHVSPNYKTQILDMYHLSIREMSIETNEQSGLGKRITHIKSLWCRHIVQCRKRKASLPNVHVLIRGSSYTEQHAIE